MFPLIRFSRMLSRLVDIPLGALQWVLSWIALICGVYTYLINKLTRNPHSAHRTSSISPIPAKMKSRTHGYLTQELAPRRHIHSSPPFRILDLPLEICALIFEHTAEWPQIYRALALTSSMTRRLAMGECLPRMGVCLLTERQVRSFGLLLCRTHGGRNVSWLIRHLWILPLRIDDLPLGRSILAKCTRVHTLATSLDVLHGSVRVHPESRELSHAELRDLCVTKTSKEMWIVWAGSESGRAVLERVGWLRLVGAGGEEFLLVDVEGGLHLPRLTGISVGTSGSGLTSIYGFKIGTRSALAMLENPTRFPVLRTVLVTCGRGSTGGLHVSRPVVDKRVCVVELPGIQTEVQMWCDNVHGRGLWALCD